MYCGLWSPLLLPIRGQNEFTQKAEHHTKPRKKAKNELMVGHEKLLQLFFCWRYRRRLSSSFFISSTVSTMTKISPLFSIRFEDITLNYSCCWCYFFPTPHINNFSTKALLERYFLFAAVVFLCEPRNDIKNVFQWLIFSVPMSNFLR